MKSGMNMEIQDLQQAEFISLEDEENQKSRNDHCCNYLSTSLAVHDSSMTYLPVTRTYSLNLDNNVITDLIFCPYCGTKLPEDLTDRLVTIIYDELELDGYDDPRLPAMFKSDEWWKRGGGLFIGF